MVFDLIPAIDVHQGRVARLTGGDPSSLRTEPGDPLAIARRFVEAGAGWIHVVDLDAALAGRPANLDVLERIAELPVRVEAGGGLSEEGVRLALERGASRAVLGAAALLEPETVERAVANHGDRVAVGLDVRDGALSPRGGMSDPGPPVPGPPVPGLLVEEAFARLAAARPALVVYTNARRDGSMMGPDLEGLAATSVGTGAQVLASGGVRSIEDLRAVAAVPGVVGAIVGRALHEGRFSLREALESLD